MSALFLGTEFLAHLDPHERATMRLFESIESIAEVVKLSSLRVRVPAPAERRLQRIAVE